MIIYNNEKDLEVELRFNDPEEAVTEIADMLVDVVLGTCHVYLNDNKQKDIMEIATEIAKNQLKEIVENMG